MLRCDMVKTWYKLLYEMIIFCWSYRQLAKALWLSLYCIRCKRQILSLLYRYAIAIVARAIVGETTIWWHIDRDKDDEDHGVMPVTMEIMTMLWRWRSKAQDDDGHIMSHILIQRHCWMKRPRPTLSIRLRETGSTKVLHAQVASGCLFLQL